MSSIWAADAGLILDMAGQQACFVECYVQLYMAEPPIGQLQTTGLQTLDADPSIDEAKSERL